MSYEKQETQVVSDFLTKSDKLKFGTGDETGSTVFKVTKSFTASDEYEEGAILFRMDVDTTVAPIVAALASGYENYSFEDFNLDIQSTSPLGTTSGAVQILYIADPLNFNFPEGPQAVAKAVRQSQSVMVRPRDTKSFALKLTDKLFTMRTGSPRFYSYGQIVGVLRNRPSVGDWISYTVTASGVCRTYKPTIISNSQQATSHVQVVLGKPRRYKNIHILPLTFNVTTLPSKLHLTFDRPLPVEFTQKDHLDREVTVFKKFSSLRVERAASSINSYYAKLSLPFTAKNISCATLQSVSATVTFTQNGE